MSLHLTHPLELGDAFRLGDPAHLDDGVRFIDWQIKNGASRGTEGLGDAEHATRGIDRGFLRTTGVRLHNQQQGFMPIVDPDDPRSDEAQIQAAIDEAVPADVLTTALFKRFRSRQDAPFADRALSAMRKMFGGHVEPK